MNLDKARFGTARTVGKGCAVSRLCEDAASNVAPCRNEAKSIDAFLNSLLNQEMGDIHWEAIIADGLSEDGTRKVLQQVSKEHPQIRMIDNPSRIASTGLNACIRAAKGEVIVRMDVHTEYKADYV